MVEKMNEFKILMDGFIYTLDLSHFCRYAFEESNHEVHPISPKDFMLFGKPILGSLAIARYNRRVLEFVKNEKPDIFFTINGKLIYRKTVEKIKDLGVKTVCWWVDFPELYSDWRKYITAYDYFFTVIPEMDLEYLDKKLPNIHYLPLGCWRVLGPRNPKFNRDICFVGTMYKNREKLVREIIKKGFKLEIFGGSEWKKAKQIIEAYAGRAVVGDEMLHEYRKSKIGLNIHQDYGIKKTKKLSVNMRAFEIPASGCFQIVDYRDDIDELFEVEKEIECFENTKDLIYKIEYYLENEDERERIAEAGRRKVLKEHTYTKRMKEMLSVIE
ncbi:hypothetical protein CW713_01240 [Methanophagales archaeon]|nr:MAG: hypothetical protein CW713_01240 [Methanophagales archaeon]